MQHYKVRVRYERAPSWSRAAGVLLMLGLPVFICLWPRTAADTVGAGLGLLLDLANAMVNVLLRVAGP
jgi:hypothetical protein